MFISTYARDHPEREDVAESVVPYLAVTLHPDRLEQGTKDKIVQTMTHRIQYFDKYFTLE